MAMAGAPLTAISCKYWDGIFVLPLDTERTWYYEEVLDCMMNSLRLRMPCSSMKLHGEAQVI